MPFHLQLAASIVLLVRDGEVSVGGTCFAFRERHNFLTAEHCVPEGAQAIVLQEPNRVQRPALAIERNPGHDVALIRTAPLEDEIGANQILDSIPENMVDGGDFMTYGYPVDEGAGGLVGRLLKGHFQRYFGYKNTRGNTYFAGEMSIATPAGHSGGPVVRASSPQSLEGVVTTNHDSYVVLDQIEEVEEDGKTLRVESRRIVTYGIAAMATSLKPWLTEIGVLDTT
jgi:hypothetical protein